MTTHFDAIVIGTGQSGRRWLLRLARAGRNVAIIERKLFGGTCVNTGCIPTRRWSQARYAAHLARRGAEYGVNITGESESTCNA
jgi:pyruvate/2-oxoglutarate dehydrogenase complex dihydrolipoamide dehydrogenase (E3) component